MRPIAVTCLVLTALFASPAARAVETVLQLNHTVSMAVPPDELLAMLRAETVAPSATEAQSRLNALSRSAAALAEPVKEVRFATIGYQVNRMAPAPQERTGQWRATQSFRLTSADAAALLNLAGAMQQKGVAVVAMQWRLAPDTDRKVRQAVARDVLRTLKDRTTDAAEALGMNFSHFRNIQLDGDDSGPSPRAAPMMARAAEAPGIVGAQDDIIVTATAQVEAVLVSR